MSTENKPGLFRRTFRRFGIAILATSLLGSLIACSMIRMQVKPIYQASSVLRVEPPSTPLYGVNTSNETFETFVKTQIMLITSPNVLTAAANNPKVQTLPRIQEAADDVQELKKVVNVSVRLGTYLIDVTMSSPDAFESAVIVNAVVEAYLFTNEEWADGMTRKQIKMLEEYDRELHTRTDELERRWKELVAKGDTDSVVLQKDQRDGAAAADKLITVEQFKQVQGEILRVHLDLIQAQAVLEAIQGEKARAATSPPKAEQKPTDPIEVASQARRIVEEFREAESKVRDLKARESALKKVAVDLKIKADSKATDTVSITLLLDQRNNIKAMQEAVSRRLEQLRYEARGETRVRRVSEATASNKPIQDLRLTLMSIVPFVLLFATSSLFLVVEAATGSSLSPVVTPVDAGPTPE